jgi:hypothetical protein
MSLWSPSCRSQNTQYEEAKEDKHARQTLKRGQKIEPQQLVSPLTLIDSGNIKQEPRHSLGYLSASYPAVRRRPRRAGLSACAQRRQLHAQFLLSTCAELYAMGT